MTIEFAMAARIFFIIVALMHIWMISLMHCSPLNSIQPKFPAIFVFGDSSVDTGNNNYINTLFKADTRPYGVDFPGKKPTGRFSNGKLVPDFVASSLGIKDTVPPFLDPKLSVQDLRTGVCFASAGSGYDQLTTALSNVIPVPKQLDDFKSYIQKMKKIMGEAQANKLIAEALVMVSAGTNDFIFNFFDIPTRRLEYDIKEYQSFLLEKIRSFVEELYDLGSRKIVIAGLPPIGCLPLQMTIKILSPKRACIKDQNTQAIAFNQGLQKLLTALQAKLSGSRIVYADVYEPLQDMINIPARYGFEETDRGCCGTGFLETSFLCNPLSPICTRPWEFVFWDSIHPTQQAYRYIAKYTIDKVIPQLH